MEDQLRAVSGDGVSATYTYYPNGLRETKTIGGVTTTYVWDGDQLVLELTGTTTTRYIRGLSLIAASDGTTTTYYQHDAHGNVVALTDSTGAVTRTYAYDAFGNELNPTVGDTNPFRYCGEYWDAETGTYYLRARNYNSAVGRFTSEDPARDGLNWYTYCYNDPIAHEDPSGNSAIAIGSIALGPAISGLIGSAASALASVNPYIVIGALGAAVLAPQVREWVE